MRRLKAFTLIEMLAVIGIMLVLMVAAFGTISLYAERIGPDSAMATLQGILNGARSYAAANGVYARVEFSVNKGSGGILIQDGSVITIKYLNYKDDTPKPIRGEIPRALGNQTFVLMGIAPLDAQTRAAVPPATGPAQVEAWRKYQDLVLKQVNKHAATALRTDTPWPYIEFDPTGYMVDDNPTTAKGLTVVTMVGINPVVQVTQFVFYPMNVLTGTRLVFE